MTREIHGNLDLVFVLVLVLVLVSKSRTKSKSHGAGTHFSVISSHRSRGVA